jgi:hypothetical protein
MTTEEVVIAIVRVLGSLVVLRWALVGGIVAILTDLSDLFLKNFLDLGGVRDYQAFDKWLDQVYLAAFLSVAIRHWRGPARDIAIGLYAFRFTGFIIYELTGARTVLLFFPNVFEFWFLFVASLPHWRPAFRYTRANTAITLATLTAAKLLQEYVLHWNRVLDRFSTIDLLNALWDGLSWPVRLVT